MASLTGVRGNVTVTAGFGAPVALFTRWQGSVDREVFEISSFDDATNERVKLGGMMHMVGTAEGTIDSATTPALTDFLAEDTTGVAGFVVSLISGVKEYGFKAILSNLSIDVAKTGVQTFTLAFESVDAITVVNL